MWLSSSGSYSIHELHPTDQTEIFHTKTLYIHTICFILVCFIQPGLIKYVPLCTFCATPFYVPYCAFRRIFKDKCPPSGTKTQVKYVNRKFSVSPAILKTFYSGAIESVLTQCISVWYGNSANQDCKALQRVVRLAERISGSALPSLQVIYLKRCKSRADKIIKDSTHPGNHLFRLLPSGKRFRSMMAKTERLRRSFFPQAIRLLNTNPVS